MNDDTPTIEQPEEDDRQRGAGSAETEAETAETAIQPRRLLRSSADRVFFGVAGGLGRYFDVDPVIFRIAFALSIFFGGLGALAYVLLAIFVPADGEPDRAQELGGRLRRAGVWRALGFVAIGILALMALLALAGGAAFAVAVGWGVPTAIVIIAIGVVLAAQAFWGGARWLIAPAVALAMGAGVAAAADLDFRGGIGQREYNPLSAKAIPADGYRLGVGQMVVDLRDLDWKSARVVHLRVDLGAGQANVYVPERVCVTGTTHTGTGESEVAGERSQGFDLDQDPGSGSTAVPRLDIDASVDVGQLRVINSDTASVDTPGFGPGPFHQDTAPQRAA